MVQDGNYLFTCPMNVTTMTGGIFMLRSPQGDSVFMYMTLVPASDICRVFGVNNQGAGGGGGVHIGLSEVSYILIFILKLSLLAFRQMSLLRL